MLIVQRRNPGPDVQPTISLMAWVETRVIEALKISLEMFQRPIFVSHVHIDDRHPALQFVRFHRREFLLPVPSNAGNHPTPMVQGHQEPSISDTRRWLARTCLFFIGCAKPIVCTPRAGIEFDGYLGLFNGWIVLTRQVEHRS